MTQNRLPASPSHVIDRSRGLTFRFDGRDIPAYEGDTIASALYASGVRVFGRSFKYHRPRGLLCVSGRCPNCMVNVDGTPNVRACTRPATAGAEVRHQNAWPSLEHDALSVLERFDRLMPVGFYYKSLYRPRALWRVAEPVIRALAGLGRVDTALEWGEKSDHVNLFCDLAVVGGGPAGCAAAIEAAGRGLRVALVDDQPSLGGHLRASSRPALEGGSYGGLPGHEVARRLAEAVRGYANIKLLSNASAFGLYEGNLVGVHHGTELVRLRSRRVVVAAGAQQVPLVFPNNDLPGVMLASAAERLANLYGVLPGRRAVVVTNDNRGLEAALGLLDAGVQVDAVADSRPPAGGGSGLAGALEAQGVRVLAPYTVRRAVGVRRVRAVVVERHEGGAFTGEQVRIACDLVCVSAGFDPATALLSQADCRLVYEPVLGETVASEMAPGVYAAGEVTGIHDVGVSMLQGRLAALEAVASLGGGPSAAPGDVAALREELRRAEGTYRAGLAVNALLSVPEPSRKRFVCLCEDVSDEDILDAIAEGFNDVQTLKRYSTVTMGPCQGKMCHRAFVGICAAATGRSVGEAGGTTPRPPVHPVPLGVLAGPGHKPFRYTSLHHKHVALGAHMVEIGEWKRPRSYGDPLDEVRAVRERVGIIDVGTLGKLDVRGEDAARLLDKVYTHPFSDLAVGRVRYGMICSDSGVILDDGVVTRLAEDRYYVTTSTGNVDLVEEWFRWWTAGTGMCVHVTNVTPGLAAMNVAGPRARETLRKLTDAELSPPAFRYMRSVEATVAGVPSLLLRIGFVGETAWEVHCPAEHGEHVWDALMEAGREFGIAPFGVEAQRVLRLEKKHLIPGQDTDVVSNPLEADMAWAVRFDREDFVGRAALMEVQERGLRNRLVGFVMEDGAVPEDGVPVLRDGRPVGKVTSSRYSPTLERGIGLAWVPIDMSEEGTQIQIRVKGKPARARVANDPAYDPEGKRLRE